ncbi:MAG: hypothetical protein GY772_10615 [bacterium]|nr:hypothetical protein [Deltaproteobacteria bacterium]MCP4241000.1 hypothetical protein [bacterium]
MDSFAVSTGRRRRIVAQLARTDPARRRGNSPQRVGRLRYGNARDTISLESVDFALDEMPGCELHDVFRVQREGVPAAVEERLRWETPIAVPDLELLDPKVALPAGPRCAGPVQSGCGGRSAKGAGEDGQVPECS